MVYALWIATAVVACQKSAPANIRTGSEVVQTQAGRTHPSNVNDARTGKVGDLTTAEIVTARTRYVTSCAACHGQRLEGGIGPSLVDIAARRSPRKIEKILRRGKGRKKPVPMPAGLVPAEEVRVLARWLVSGPQMEGSN